MDGSAEQVGINDNILYEWVNSDSEFTTALERLKDIQKNEPFITETEKEIYVTSMLITFLLMETKDRHYKSQNS